MVEVGKYNVLKVLKKVDFGFYLDGGDGQEILLPKRFVPEGLQEDDELEVFIYHDNEGKLIATTQKANGAVGDIVEMEVVSITPHGAFLDWGIMKDVFLPLSQQRSRIYKGERYLVLLYIDQVTGRVTATEKLGKSISNEVITVNEGDEITMRVYHQTEIGYKVIINNAHWGVLHYSDVFTDLDNNTVVKGYVKTIRDKDIDVAIGEKGYKRISKEAEKVLNLLKENDGYLPYHDKSAPEDIYDFFAMSKKAFKMATGSLYKQKIINFTKTGIQLIED